MPLTFHPDPGSIVICDFSTGFRAPEMVKVRPVVILSPRRRRSAIATVVPLSSSEPAQPEPWHHQIRPGLYPPARGAMWAKGDMVVAVSLDRLDRVRMRDAGGNRVYLMPRMTAEEFDQLQAAVRVGLGLRMCSCRATVTQFSHQAQPAGTVIR